jgi:threonine/homoserine/homoserine lactone efflux protein
MGDAIGQVLLFGLGVALSPLPIIGVVLMLGTPRGRANGPAFVGGWVVGLTGIGAVILLVSSGADASQNGQPADWVNVLKLVLGVLLLLVAVRQWRSRPAAGIEPPMPKWMKTIGGFNAGRAAALGLALAVLNPKNLLLTVSAAAAIAQTGASTGSQAVALGVFVLIGTVSTGGPVVFYFAMGDRSQRTLGALQSWMAQHNTAIMAVLCLVIGAKLIGDAISGFST